MGLIAPKPVKPCDGGVFAHGRPRLPEAGGPSGAERRIIMTACFFAQMADARPYQACGEQKQGVAKGEIMRGTILAAGMILAADGNRYSYRPEDIQPANGEGRPAVLNRGDEVEFIAHGQAAKEICLANTRLIGMNASAGKENLVFIRILGMAGAALILLCEALNLSKTIPSIGYSCHIAGFVCISLAIILLSNKIASPTLKKNYIIFLITFPVGLAIIGTGFLLILISAGLNTIFTGKVIIAGILVLIYSHFKEFQVCNELSKISGNKFFLYYFICAAAIIPASVIDIEKLFLFIALIPQLIAWYRLRNIKAA